MLLRELSDPNMRSTIADSIPKLTQADAALITELMDRLASRDSALAGNAEDAVRTAAWQYDCAAFSAP
jgi:hypothetical protein